MESILFAVHIVSFKFKKEGGPQMTITAYGEECGKSKPPQSAQPHLESSLILPSHNGHIGSKTCPGDKNIPSMQWRG